MTDEELTNIYNEAYKLEFEHNFPIVNHYYEQARDKTYATKLGFGIASLLYAFANTSKLDKKISDTFEHMYKLGASIAETIRVIPSLIDDFKNEEVKHDKNNVSIEWKRFLFIPYKIKKVTIESKLNIASAFENLTSLEEIATAFGKQRAIIELHEQLKIKYIEVGGLSEISEKELKENNLLPFEYATLTNLKTSLANNNLVEFFRILQSVFATMSYDMKITEGFFHSHIHMLLTILDFKIDSEVETNEGRIDSVIETENYIHILEFKQSNSDVAIEQILKKKYYQKYFTTKKKIILVGVAVDKDKRNIIDWKMETYN